MATLEEDDEKFVKRARTLCCCCYLFLRCCCGCKPQEEASDETEDVESQQISSPAKVSSMTKLCEYIGVVLYLCIAIPLYVLTCGCCRHLCFMEDEAPEWDEGEQATKEEILAQIESNSKGLHSIPHRFLLDKDIVMAAVRINGLALEHANTFTKDKDIVLAAVTQNGLSLRHAGDPMKGDTDVVMAAVNNDGLSLQYASNPMKATRQVVLAAASQNGDAFRVASNDMRDSKEVALAAIQNDAFYAETFHYAGPTVRGDKEVAMAAVSRNGLELRYALDHLKMDRDVVLAAVTNNGRALGDASYVFKIDKPIVLQAVSNNGSAIEFAADILKEDKVVVMTAIRQDVSILERHISNKLKSDLDFALEVVTEDGTALPYFSEEVKANRDVVMAAVKQKWYLVQFASESLRGDKTIILAAAAHNLRAVEYATDDLKKSDRDVSRLVFEMEWKRKNFSKDGGQTYVKQATLEAIAKNPRAFQFAPTVLRSDKEVVLAAVKRNSEMLKFALGGLNQDRDCWIAAGLWSEEQDKKKKSKFVVRVALSTKFSLEEKSSSSVTHFTRLLNDNPFFRDGNFAIYSPNAFSKDTCDPNWTRIDWPCRGTFDTCTKDPHLKKGKPQLECCWRYSFRWHLEEAQRTNGFMIQVVDLEGEPGLFEESMSEYRLGDGQKIESEVAKSTGTKIFRIYRPRIITPTNAQVLQDFRPDHIDSLVYILQEWYNGDCIDMGDHEILCEDKFDKTC